MTGIDLIKTIQDSRVHTDRSLPEACDRNREPLTSGSLTSMDTAPLCWDRPPNAGNRDTLAQDHSSIVEHVRHMPSPVARMQ